MTSRRPKPSQRSGKRRRGTTEPNAGGARQPRQERGQRRFDAILDATARIIAEEGVEEVKLHHVARQSDTTTGSMYHFFPDRAALLFALRHRHATALQALMEQLQDEALGQWAKLSTDEAVARFTDPFLGYIEAHPDLLPLGRFVRAADPNGRRNAELDGIVIRLAEALVASRCAGASAADVNIRALVLTAMIEGVVDTAARTGRALGPALLRRELQRALVAYLDSHARRDPRRPTE